MKNEPLVATDQQFESACICLVCGLTFTGLIIGVVVVNLIK